MWLVQLYKGNDSVPTGSVFHTADCSIEYIDPPDSIYEEAQQNLCESWDEPTKKRTLIINKSPGEIIISPLRNERFMLYHYHAYDESLYTYSYIFSLEYLQDASYVLDFYVDTKIVLLFNLPSGILQTSDRYNRMRSFLDYIKGRTFKISVRDNTTPKYSLVFDDNCKYYYINYEDNYIRILAVKNTFLLRILLHTSEDQVIIRTYIKPKLVEDFNNYERSESTYNSENDQPLLIDEIINAYFDVNNKTGISYENVDINDTNNNFGYNLIRALLDSLRSEIVYEYKFSLGHAAADDLYYAGSSSTYIPINQRPICTYFPLFRPQIDYSGFSNGRPQYDPNDASKYVYHLDLRIGLDNLGQVMNSQIRMGYDTSMLYEYTCFMDGLDRMPAWRSDSCDLTLPFRFVGASDCDAIDYWAHNGIEYNANYLFRIVKPAPPDSESNTYNIKGVGCEELTTEVTGFSDFSNYNAFYNSIHAYPIVELHRINFSGSGYSIGTISSTLATFREEMANNETCFVLFNESLVESASEFLSIYQAITSALPNAIVCYIGGSETVPSTHKNKIIHSDTVVTDLDTNESIPLVVKYIRYAKRLNELFNRYRD